MIRTLRLAALSLFMAMSCIAAPRAGVAPADGSIHVGAVEITQQDAGAPAAFTETLRNAVLKEAALYGGAGQPITLRIVLQKVHLKNPMKAMLIGDNSLAKGSVVVIDPGTGNLLGTFTVKADGERHGLSGGGVAMTLLGALDPTGYADVGLMAAGAASADINRSGTEAMMSLNFARETLRQTFGDAKAKAVHAAKH